MKPSPRAESFDFEAEPPFVIGLVAMDFRENDTGLEYIGTRRQQMGDGGLIAQIRDAAGGMVAVSKDDWQCFVTHTAPLDRACEAQANPVAGEGTCGFESTFEPDGWGTASFEASGWPAATLYSPRQVDPKDGYDQIAWDADAELIRGTDLELSNTVLCRLIVE